MGKQALRVSFIQRVPRSSRGWLTSSFKASGVYSLEAFVISVLDAAFMLQIEFKFVSII